MTEHDWLKEFADILREHMDERGFDQAKLARVAEIDRSIIYKYLNARQTPTIYNYMRLAFALDVSFDDLGNLGEPPDREERLDKNSIYIY